MTWHKVGFASKNSASTPLPWIPSAHLIIANVQERIGGALPHGVYQTGNALKVILKVFALFCSRGTQLVLRMYSYISHNVTFNQEFSLFYG